MPIRAAQAGGLLRYPARCLLRSTPCGLPVPSPGPLTPGCTCEAPTGGFPSLLTRSPMARSDSGFSPPQTGNTGKRHLRVLGSVALLALAFAPGASWALFSDRVELWAAENVTHDSNVFRLSPSRDPRSIGVLKLSATITTTSLGGTLDLLVRHH